MRLPIFFCIATHLFLCEVFAIHEEFTLKRPPENYLPQKNMSADFISPQFKTQFVLVPTINSRESEKIGDTQKNQINSLLYANFRNRFRKEFEILKIQGIKKSRGDEEMLTLYYDTILVEINDRIVLLGDTQNITGPKRALLLALEAYKQEVEREREKIQPLF